jgi:hypothetical protein
MVKRKMTINVRLGFAFPEQVREGKSTHFTTTLKIGDETGIRASN